MPRSPVILIVRDGWGRNPHSEHDSFNAVKLAATPHCDDLLDRYPWTLIQTSGEDVGLPPGTMGNSEVGHQNIGAGRVVDQDSVRITKAIESGEFFANAVLIEAIDRARQRQACVHLLGIASDAGVHGRLSHLYACLAMCRQLDHPRVALHLFTDGRDTGPFEGRGFVEQIEAECCKVGVGSVASICGRYYAMDRDYRWERIELAYTLLTDPNMNVLRFNTAAEAMKDYYGHPTQDRQQGDEFVTPRMVGSDPDLQRIQDGDTVIFYNYRGDRPRELTRAFVMDEFHGHVPPSPDSGCQGFGRGRKLDLCFVTMTAYEKALDGLVRVAYPKPPGIVDSAGEYLSKLGFRQLRCAETEKFPHVTFFFNDYREEPFDGEHRQMVQSPKVSTYDLQPQMSAFEIRDMVLDRLRSRDCEEFILVNFANGDMVGHTGRLDAAIEAIEAVDLCVGQIASAVVGRGDSGKMIVTADHGNAEQMFDPRTQSPHTAHTLYDVECIIVGDQFDRSVKLRKGGRLADVFPTVLALMGLPQPPSMTGQSLLF